MPSFNYYLGPYRWEDDGFRARYDWPVGATSALDLRPIPLLSVPNNSSGFGVGLFSVPVGSVLGSDYSFVGSGYISEVLSDSSSRSAWSSLTGVTVPETVNTLGEMLAYTLTDGADPTGDAGPYPLVPEVTPITEAVIDLQGHSVVWRKRVDLTKPGGRWESSLRTMIQKRLEKLSDNVGPHWRSVLGATVEKYGPAGRWDDGNVEEAFLTPKLRAKGKRSGRFALPHSTTKTETWPSAGAITSGQDNTWTYYQGSNLTVVSNELRGVTPNTFHSKARLGYAFATDDNAAKVYATSNVTATSSAFVVQNRKDSNDSTQTHYELQWYEPGNLWTLYRWVSAVYTNIQSSTTTMSIGSYIEITANGSSIAGNKNGGSNLSGTDTAIPSGLYCGTGIYVGSSGTVGTDDYSARSLAASRLSKNIIYSQAIRRASLY